MTFQERNEEVLKAVSQFKAIHDDYTSNLELLTTAQWETYIHAMDEITEKYKGTNLYIFVGKLQLAFCDDTQEVQKQIKDYKNAKNN